MDQSWVDVLLARMTTQTHFEPEEHPRAPAGGSTGGQFAVAKSGGAKTAPKAASSGGKAKPKKPASGDMYYDPNTKHGTGYGNPDPRVKKLQDALNRLGLTDADGKPLRVDGELGPKTTAAIKKAQKQLGVAQDGRVTPALLEKILAAKPMAGRSAMDLCVRSFDFELRGEPGDGLTMEGYAAVFNTPTRIRAVGGDFDEVIHPDAFTRSLKVRTPVLQWDHGRDPAVGTAPIGDVRDLYPDEHGLFVRARLYDHPSTGRVRQAIAGRSVKGMSFRFGVPDKGDVWTRRAGEPDLREIRDADVHELGPVVFPAYPATTVSVRSLLAGLDPEERRELIRELAAELRLAADLTDLVGQPGARSAGGDEPEAEPGSGPAAAPHLRQRLDDGALRARGILL